MAQQFVVPQFIDEEAKIIGSVTGRQFVILMVTALILFIIYKLADFALFLLLGIPFLLFGVVLAFVKIRGQKFHYFLLNFISRLFKPNVRSWMKQEPEITDTKKKKKEKHEELVVLERKPITKDRLTELSLTVNTGGSYNSEDY